MSAPTSQPQAVSGPVPFSVLSRSLRTQSNLRSAITRAYRAPEQDCVSRLLEMASLPQETLQQARFTAETLVKALRAKGSRGPVEGLVREYDLSSEEGVALMCLAEALLRIPDRTTRDALIRDKIGARDWRSHVGHSPSLFVNAATWGLVITGKLTATASETGFAQALSRLAARGGEPLIRRGVDMAMRMMGEQFVTGQTIAEALANSRRLEARGFRYSYDMLGEAAITADDAARYYRAYEQAIHAIGKASNKRGIYEGPGISVKLSALHPRYTSLQRERVMNELLPRLRALTLLARQYDVGLNIDAEEAERLDLSLDLLEALCFVPELAGWNGIGFVVQAYQKRAPFVIDWLVDLAKRSGHRLMVRLVKGAYWDSEIKRAQVDGLEDFPVFTRKVHTDVSYIACARKLLAAPEAIFPQFATHNAYSVAAIHAMAGEHFFPGQYEFQCLHGMGEPLYEEIVGPGGLNRPCRIYAPVGTHETLLAYLVRRLLENGANSSFVKRIHDPAISIEDLIADPAEQVAARHPIGTPHEKIALPRQLFGPARLNSAGLDLTNEQHLASLAIPLSDSSAQRWTAEPMLGAGTADGQRREVLNPAGRCDVAGFVNEANADQVDHALTQAAEAAAAWRATSPEDRASCLLRAADLLEARMPVLLGLIVREAGKSLPNAIAEVREAVDFLRYYAVTARDALDNRIHRPLGLVACISPWNFPLAIFTGQVAAALAAGNAVIAKPAEETPLIAAQAVAILREAGVPTGAVQLLPGAGEVGARLVADRRTNGVLFTGSTEVARVIQRELALRLGPDGAPIPLIAETGGQNAMIVDSSALTEQVVADVLVSAFDSAGQRCSALRVLCLQEDIAERTLAMLRGAMAELSIGKPDRLSTDVGPVISAEARDLIEAHIQAMRDTGRTVHQIALPEEASHGSFVPPTLIEIECLSELNREVFGPVLHVLRYRREDLDALVRSINATGYALTFGVHSRIDETIERLTAAVQAGNVYVNRNIVGAVVGVQPFGGLGLSGTGPKAGGPLYLHRLLAAGPPPAALQDGRAPPSVLAWDDYLRDSGEPHAAAAFKTAVSTTPAGVDLVLPGPVGEHNRYLTEARGSVLCLTPDHQELLRQISSALATGNRALVDVGALEGMPALPQLLLPWICETADINQAAFEAVLFAGSAENLMALHRVLAARGGPIIQVHLAQPGGRYPLEWLVRERSICVNTAAAGGNASLLMIS